jgi:hypothetical protein
MEIFRETQQVIRDPQEYSDRGQNSLLLAEDCDFMVELVCTEPGLFLNEMRERLYNNSGTLVGLSTLATNLVEKLSITLKKPDTINICKNLVAKYQYIARMANVPAKFLVFTGKPILYPASS